MFVVETQTEKFTCKFAVRLKTDIDNKALVKFAPFLNISNHRDLKTKIEKEDTKRELLGTETSLTESYCIRCLKPFKFLVNNKRQCLDCHMHICKSCSHYNKKELGWVCDPCHMSRYKQLINNNSPIHAS